MAKLDVVERSSEVAGMVCNLFSAFDVEEKIGHAACIIMLASGIAMGRTTREKVIAALDLFVEAAKLVDKGDKDGKSQTT